MDTIKLAYYAGFMDGEGTITIKRYYRDTKKGKKVAYLPMSSCSQVNKEPNASIIRQFKEDWGGSIYVYEQKPHRGDRIPTIQWSIASSQALRFLNEILPYLKIKDKQAKIAIEFCKGLSRKGDPKRLSDEENKKREDFFYQMRVFNVKGKLRLQRLSELTPKGDAIV